MRSAAAFVALLVIVLALIWSLQRRMIYFPMGDVPAPGEGGLARFELVRFATADGIELSGWFLPAPGSVPPATVIVFNGNAGNRAHRVELADALRKHGLQVLLMDYRGYGGNPGAPSERGLTEDGRAVYAYAAGRPDVDASRFVYFGESLGAAVAVGLASEHAPAALILRSPFTSLTEVGQHHYPFLPVRLLLRDRFPSIDRVRIIDSPLLVIAGDRDRIVPIEQSRRLFDAALDPKELVVIAGADHNDHALLAGDEMVEAIVRFIDQHASKGSDPTRGSGPTTGPDPRRTRMVEEQIARRGVNDPRVLDAMGSVPRDRFVPPDQAARAYDDRPLPIGRGQTISQPYVVAYMTEMLAVGPNHRVLEIGTGSGYQAAILGELAREVFSIEIIPELAARASATLKQLGYAHVQVRDGDGYAGWPEHAPFDRIIVTAAVQAIPQPLLDQLAPGGVLVAPVGSQGRTQWITIAERTDRGVIQRRTIAVQFVPFTRRAS
ncbi:MAG TPA: protein-L-isoaspartate(D-aspartate) O-methyltransferase [Vicinamibacterales bacterium]